MSESRIEQYRKVVQGFAEGSFDVELPGGGSDETARLGQTLVDTAGQLQRRFTELEQIAALTEKINAGILLEDVLSHVYDSFRALLPYDRIGFSLIEDDGSIVRAVWARSESPTLHLEKGYWAPLQGSSLQRIILTGEPRILNDLQAYLQDHPQSDSTRRVVKEGMQSSLTCPLVALGKAIGFVFFSSMQPRVYEEAHVELYRKLAGQLAIIVEKGRLYNELLDAKRHLEEANSQLEVLASLDPLTCVPNRRQLDEHLDREWRRAMRQASPLTLLMADIDHFKAYNDHYGHQSGDDCLQAVANTLQHSLQRADDFVARYGGEEFVVVLASTGAEEGESTARMLHGAVQSLAIPHARSKSAQHISLSIGAATMVPGRDSAPSVLLAAADRALYEAKNAGGNLIRAADFTESLRGADGDS